MEEEFNSTYQTFKCPLCLADIAVILAYPHLKLCVANFEERFLKGYQVEKKRRIEGATQNELNQMQPHSHPHLQSVSLSPSPSQATVAPIGNSKFLN